MILLLSFLYVFLKIEVIHYLYSSKLFFYICYSVNYMSSFKSANIMSSFKPVSNMSRPVNFTPISKPVNSTPISKPLNLPPLSKPLNTSISRIESIAPVNEKPIRLGNSLTDPKRFIEKKILHEQFGMKDPKFPDKPHLNDCEIQKNIMLKTNCGLGPMDPASHTGFCEYHATRQFHKCQQCRQSKL
jgi:hypothetical protein